VLHTIDFAQRWSVTTIADGKRCGDIGGGRVAQVTPRWQAAFKNVDIVEAKCAERIPTTR